MLDLVTLHLTRRGIPSRANASETVRVSNALLHPAQVTPSHLAGGQS